MKTNQKGIAIVAIILLIVLVGLVGATGWYVYNSNKKTNESLTNAQNSVNSAADAAKKASDSNKTTTPTPSPTPTPTSTQNSQKYLVIKEWGVKVPLSDKILDAYYKIDSDSAKLSTTSIAKKYPGCSPENVAQISYKRFNDPSIPYYDTTYGKAFPDAKKIGAYQYIALTGNSGCSGINYDDVELVKVMGQEISDMKNEFSEAIKKIEKI